MASSVSDLALSELLGLLLSWLALWRRPISELHGLQISKRTSALVAIFLVVFQSTLLRGGSDTLLTTPLITLGTLIANPSSWMLQGKPLGSSTLSMAVISIFNFILLFIAEPYAIHPDVLVLICLLAAVAFFGIYSRLVVKNASENLDEAPKSESQPPLQNIARFACLVSLLSFIALVTQIPVNFGLSLVARSLLVAGQAYGLVMFGQEFAIASSATISASCIVATTFAMSHTIGKITFFLAFVGCVRQVAVTGPKSNDKRMLLLSLLFIPSFFLTMLSNREFAPAAGGEPISLSTTTLLSNLHPVQALHATWTDRFNAKLDRQSRTLKEAVAEYERRYHRSPPPAFDRWWIYANENDYVLPDEFDTLMTQLEPFWSVSPADLKARMESAMAGDGEMGILEAEVRGVNISFSSEHWYSDSISMWFDRWAHLDILPDLNFLFNAIDEPRSIPRPTNTSATSNRPLTDESASNDVKWISFKMASSWPAMAPSCPNQGHPEINDESSYMLSFNGVDFLDGSSSLQDICTSTSLRLDHGLYLSPDNLEITHDLIPIFSQAAPRRWGDILMPTPFYYYEADMVEAEVKLDTPWETKSNAVYWAGRNTGAAHTLENWMHISRSRVAMMTNETSMTPVTLFQRNRLGRWQPIQTVMRSISQYFKIILTVLVQCYDGACEAMAPHFDLGPRPANESSLYKYNLDIDGNSYSGRYYRLLKGNSCVIKSTIFREWHDDILTPWVHYIPLSNSASEFGELVRFLNEEPEGEVIGETIAANSKLWAQNTLRKPDMEVYALRMFMEYARLVDEHRDTNSFRLT